MANEKVGIEIELMGGEEAYALLQRIDNKIETLNKRKKFNTLGGLKSAKGELEGYIKELGEIEQKSQKIRQSMEKWGEPFKKSAAGQRLSKELEESERRAEEVRGKISKMGSEMQSVVKKTRTFKQEFNSITSAVAHVGSAMQSLGNSLLRISTPFRRLTSGLLLGAGYKALNLITEGFSGAFERYDVMKNYSRTLEALGFQADQAQASVEKLNDAVLGLPTGLDEIVAAQKVYVGATNDLTKATDIAIAANNTFLASGMGSREQRFMQKYLVALGSGANLAATQWDSMARIAPMAMRAVSKELGYADSDYNQFTKDVKNGTVATEDFLDAFVKVGSSGAIADAANVMKMSFEGLSANIQNAAKRMGEGIIKSLDEVFQGYNGRTLLQTLLGVDAEGHDMGDGIKHWIDDLSASIQNWIKSHPEEITEFFETLKSMDWKGLLKGFGEGMLEVLDLFKRFAEWASDKDLSKVGKFMAWSNVIGNVLMVLGGFLKGTRHIWAGAWIGGKLLGKGKLGKLGIFGKLAQIFGKSKDADEAAKTAGKIPKVSDTFKSAFASLEGLIKAAGALTLVAGTGAVVFASAKSILKNLKEMVDLVNGGGWDNVGYVGGGVILAIGTFTEIFNAIGTALGPQGLLGTAIASAASLLVTGTLWADTELIKDGLYNIRDTIKGFDEVADAINNMKGFTSLGDDAKTKISNTIDTIREVANLLVGKNGGPASRGEYSQGLPMFVGARANGVKNIANALKSMQDIVTNVNALASMGINAQGNIKSKLETIGNVIDEVYKAFPTWAQGGISGPGNLSKNAAAFADALIGIRRMAYHINKLGATSVDTAGFSSFISQLKTALEELKSIQGDLMLDITVKLAPGFQKSVNATVKKINNAKKDIDNALKGIKTTYNKNININLNAKVNVKGVGEAISQGANAVSQIANSIPTHSATGGMVYRAKGGSIPFFKRRGTDTVPAMLTPGEYVHNKRAVSAFGIDFMRKVNNLDMKGAMNELMHRAGGMANINRGTSIVNNNYNNQKVTINNNGNTGAGFTFKSASRFVGAF